MATADFNIKQTKLGILRGCLEEYSSSPHTIGTGRYYESHWKDGWNDVIDILEQVAARNQHLQRAEETCTSLRVRSLLRTAIDDALFASPCDDRTIRVGIPDFGDSWPRYHAAVGSYHYGAVQKTRQDLIRLKDAWLRLDSTKTLPEASWRQTAIDATQELQDELIPRMRNLCSSSPEPRTATDPETADN